MKKVLIINTVAFKMGGISSVIVNYYRQMNKKKFQMDIVVKDKIAPPYEQLFRNNDSKLYFLNRNSNVFGYMYSLYKIIKNVKYEVVHVHGNSATMAVDLVPALLAGCKVRIAHCHNTQCGHRMIHRFLNPIFKRCYTKAFACSRKAGEWIFGINHFSVIPNGISVCDYHFFEQVRDKVRKELELEDKFVIGHVGYMNEQKNHQKLLEILEDMKSDSKDVHLLCVTGNDNVPEHLQRMIKEKHLENNIKILFKRSDVNQLLQAMDVFVLPSRWEGLPVALLEAQASGLSCIVSNCVTRESDISGMVEFVDLNASCQEWCNAIRKVHSQHTDRLQRYDDIHQSLYNIENCCKLLEDCYEAE